MSEPLIVSRAHTRSHQRHDPAHGMTPPGAPLGPDDRARAFLTGKRVLVTGGAGSIGSAVVRMVAEARPAELYALDINESDLYMLERAIERRPHATPVRSIVANVTNTRRMRRILADLRPDVLVHAAAYKHVPMMEIYPEEAIEVNTLGTWRVAQIAAEVGVGRFVLVSSDKAVRPVNIMGASKRLAEIAVRAVSAQTGLDACAVRFGNVLGSRGSAIPIFEEQIEDGGPITLTHPDMARYFMSIPEAVRLILEAAAMPGVGVVFMLDMGHEIGIRQLAEDLVRAYGLEPGVDIDIVYTGIRPGEKLHETLSLDFEAALPTAHDRIHMLRPNDDAPDLRVDLEALFAPLVRAIEADSRPALRAAVATAITRIDGPVPIIPAAAAPGGEEARLHG